MELRYFAWVRERIGLRGESYQGQASNVGELLDELIARGEGYASAIADRDLIIVAVDQEIASSETLIQNAKEVAIFPPMTGG